MSKSGVLPSQSLYRAISRNAVTSRVAINDSQVQPNSLDLRVSDVGYKVVCSFLPGAEGFKRKVERFKLEQFTVPSTGVVLSPNQPYIFPLYERLELPTSTHGRANPKSTTGRLDIFTRLVTENGTAFDEVPKGYNGALYLEVVPRSFAVKVRPGDCLAQLRLQVGDPCLSDAETKALVNEQDVVLTPDFRPLRADDLDISNGITLSVDLSGINGNKQSHRVGYQAIKNSSFIDLQSNGAARISDHWNSVTNKRPVILHPDDFYLFRSHELIRLPPMYCAEMVAFDPSSGEVRTHYAGFFDSGFGYESDTPSEKTASAVVLEVRSRDVPFLIEDKQPLFRVHILRCHSEPQKVYSRKIGSHYQSQGLRLPKQFKPEDEGAGYQNSQESLSLD